MPPFPQSRAPGRRAGQNAHRVPKREPNSRTYELRRNFGNLFPNQHSKAREAHVCQLCEAELHPAVRALPAPRQVQPAFGVTAGRVTSASLTFGFLLHVGLAPFFPLQREMFQDDRETRTFLQQEFFIHAHATSAACPS